MRAVRCVAKKGAIKWDIAALTVQCHSLQVPEEHRLLGQMLYRGKGREEERWRKRAEGGERRRRRRGGGEEPAQRAAGILPSLSLSLSFSLSPSLSLLPPPSHTHPLSPPLFRVNGLRFRHLSMSWRHHLPVFRCVCWNASSSSSSSSSSSRVRTPLCLGGVTIKKKLVGL